MVRVVEGCGVCQIEAKGTMYFAIAAGRGYDLAVISLGEPW